MDSGSSIFGLGCARNGATRLTISYTKLFLNESCWMFFSRDELTKTIQDADFLMHRNISMLFCQSQRLGLAATVLFPAMLLIESVCSIWLAAYVF